MVQHYAHIHVPYCTHVPSSAPTHVCFASCSSVIGCPFTANTPEWSLSSRDPGSQTMVLIHSLDRSLNSCTGRFLPSSLCALSGVLFVLPRQPEFDEEEKVPSSKVQLLSREFACTVSPVRFCVSCDSRLIGACVV